LSTAGHVVLCGLPGSGKTQVGETLAGRLGRQFYDLDQVIREHTGKTIPELFADPGEVGFRAFEQFFFGQMRSLDGPAVIATGGGTLASDAGLAIASELGTLVWLSLTPEAAAENIDDDGNRPLLSGGKLDRLRGLLRDRAGHYGLAARVVDASGAPNDVAERVESALGQAERVITVHTSRGAYPIRVAVMSNDELAVQLAAWAAAQHAVLICDHRLAERSTEVVASMAELGVRATALTVEAGEQLKRLSSMESIAVRLAELGCDRDTLLVAVGGGSITDAVGFLAAVYLRGVRWLAVPSTLLGMVDSAIGGKTGVNLDGGKNLLGAVYPPLAVISDLSWLRDLGPTEIRSGAAEIIKMAATHDAAFFETVTRADLASFAGTGGVDLVARAAAIKASVVSADEFETGLRRVLNFGHTFGHAFESAAGLSGLRHGEAVALGMLAVTEYAVAKKAADGTVLAALTFGAEALGLPTEWRSYARSARAFLGRDKKRQGSRVRLVIVPRLGQFQWLDAELSELDAFLEEQGEGS
jgi:3-dehydroquinate synthase